MHEEVILGIGLILILGITAQWIGWRLRLPAILPLLLTGFLAGPVLGILHPDELLGQLLFPTVSISVAIILFEGGLSLKREEIMAHRGVVQWLVTIGVLITWLGAWAAAALIFGLDNRVAALLGAIVVVSGPTVVIPLLRFVRPVSRVRSILQWEGILVDPVGATLAVLVLGGIIAGDLSFQGIILGIGLTLTIGGLIGLAAGWLTVRLFSRGWVPDYLQTAVTLMVVIGAFLLSNHFREESGLMTVTVMGIYFANQKRVSIADIVSFKEELGILLLSVLFIVLAARMHLTDFENIGWEAALFLGVLILVLRPLAAWVSTIGSGLDWRERTFLSWMAPRGIVAAAVASLFALDLINHGVPGAEMLLPLTFIVVVGTVTVYAITAGPLARYLGLVETNPQGTLIVGAHGWSRKIAGILQNAGFEIWLVDTNPANVRAARMEGLQAIQGSILADDVIDQIPLSRIGRMFALTSNSELNALAGMLLGRLIGRDKIFVLVSELEGLSQMQQRMAEKHQLLGPDKGFEFFDSQFREGAVIEPMPVENGFSWEQFRQDHKKSIPLFLIADDELHIMNKNTRMLPQAGHQLVSLVTAGEFVEAASILMQSGLF